MYILKLLSEIDLTKGQKVLLTAVCGVIGAGIFGLGLDLHSNALEFFGGALGLYGIISSICMSFYYWG